MDQERLILVAMALIWMVNLTVIFRRFLAWWRRTGNDKRPIQVVGEKDEDWLPYALLTDMMDNERLRRDRDRKP